MLSANMLLTRSKQYLKLWLSRFGFRPAKKIVEDNFVIESIYEWKGIMLDVARHCVSVEYLKKLIDKMSAENLNKLHLHLTDDQGWRMEIKKYPKLHLVGGTRRETVVGKYGINPFTAYKGDGLEYSKYFTQDELRQLVKYAGERGVEIIPEIDLPGHSTAMLVAYPEYSAGPAPKEVATSWGVFSSVVNDDEKTINFLKDIFDEVCDVFPGKYIHIGGDEVSLVNYDNNSNRPKKVLSLLAQYLKEKGREVVVWNEAKDVAKEVDGVVMAWQGVEEGYEALIEGCRVVFCPVSHFYFDYYQKDPKTEPLAIGGYLPVEQVDSFKIDQNISRKYGNKILGVQANVWTEYMPTEASVDYMIFPRFHSLARVANGANRDSVGVKAIT